MYAVMYCKVTRSIEQKSININDVVINGWLKHVHMERIGMSQQNINHVVATGVSWKLLWYKTICLGLYPCSLIQGPEPMFAGIVAHGKGSKFNCCKCERDGPPPHYPDCRLFFCPHTANETPAQLQSQWSQERDSCSPHHWHQCLALQKAWKPPEMPGKHDLHNMSSGCTEHLAFIRCHPTKGYKTLNNPSCLSVYYFSSWSLGPSLFLLYFFYELSVFNNISNIFKYTYTPEVTSYIASAGEKQKTWSGIKREVNC